MPENMKTRPRVRSGRAATPGSDTPVTETPLTEMPLTEVVAAPADEHAPNTEAPGTEASDTEARHDATPDNAQEATAPVAPDGAVGWAEAVPWLALRWGSAPTAAEVRFAPVVWAMLHAQTGSETAGRTVLQMAAEAELAGHTDLDPNTLTRVLGRYEKAGIVQSVTDGRLARWSVLAPADIITSTQNSARAGASATRAGRAATARVSRGTVTTAGGLRGLVADHLAAHPDQDFSPTQIANALDRSSGAVANALERLTEHETAVQTSTTPRRYQHHTDPAHDNAQDGALPDGTGLDQKAS